MKNNIYSKFNDSIKDSCLDCSENDLKEYLGYGLLLQIGNNYYDRSNNLITVELQKPKSFNIDFNSIIASCTNMAKNNYEKRIYCMTQRRYNKYKELGYIITKNNKEYFRIFDKEEWLVNKLEEVQ